MAKQSLPKKSTSLRLELETVQALCLLIDSPRSLHVHLLIENEQWEDLVSLEIDPDHYLDASAFADDLLVTKILSKSPSLPLNRDRRQAALDAFLASEAQCERTNSFLNRHRDVDLPVWCYEYQKELRRILGPLNRSALDHISSSMRHGPGATTSVRGIGLVPPDKFDREIQLTANLYPYARAVMGERWINAHPNLTIVPGNKFTTVPKSAKTDRPACVEPTLNMYFQLGIGARIRSRLRLFGVDLDYQDRNRELAEFAYDRQLATIDLSAASDSISKVLVQRFLPPEWVHLLMEARSPSVSIDGKTQELEKLSSMGNGFTFELESLLFYALCRTVVPSDELENVSVFGDDIILPQAYASELISRLGFLGFKTNTSKSFLAGSFFESCGTDWFMGQNVRPFFLKGKKPTFPYSVQIANALRIYAHRRGSMEWCDSRFREIWISLVQKSPALWRKARVPYYMESQGLVTSEREVIHARKPSGKRQGWEGKLIRSVQVQPVSKAKYTFGVLLYELTNVGQRVGHEHLDLLFASRENPTYGIYPKRGFLRDPRLGWTLITEWPGSFVWS